MKLTQKALCEVLDYDPDTGKLFWKRRAQTLFSDAAKCAGWNTRYAGREALTCLDAWGYPHGSVMGHNIKAHQAAWIITHGYAPKTIDHINHVKADNRLANLRNVEIGENKRNLPKRRDNSSGVTGVSIDKGRWRSRITVGGEERLLGYFDTFDDAVAARQTAEIELGFHRNHGKTLEPAA